MKLEQSVSPKMDINQDANKIENFQKSLLYKASSKMWKTVAIVAGLTAVVAILSTREVYREISENGIGGSKLQDTIFNAAYNRPFISTVLPILSLGSVVASSHFNELSKAYKEMAQMPSMSTHQAVQHSINS